MVGQHNMRNYVSILGTAACMALGLGLALSAAPAMAQSGTGAGQTSTGSGGSSTAQPPTATDLDTDFWVLVRDSADPGALQSYPQASHPASSPTRRATRSPRCAGTTRAREFAIAFGIGRAAGSACDCARGSRREQGAGPRAPARVEACRLPRCGRRRRVGRQEPHGAQGLRAPRQRQRRRRGAQRGAARRGAIQEEPRVPARVRRRREGRGRPLRPQHRQQAAPGAQSRRRRSGARSPGSAPGPSGLLLPSGRPPATPASASASAPAAARSWPARKLGDSSPTMTAAATAPGGSRRRVPSSAAAAASGRARSCCGSCARGCADSARR